MTTAPTKNLTKEECQGYQQAVTAFCQLVMVSDFDLIERYIEQTRLQVDGTMDVILPHFMSMRDMETGKGNVRFLREIGQHLLAIRKTVTAKLQQEAA